ncbi:MAG: L-threonylcarbamoyladenylate synthase [Candidatus Margulisiibacteriota bacterium]
MQKLKISHLFPRHQSIDLAVEALNAGKVIIFPTETVYGIGCSLQHLEAIKRIFEIKGRPADKPLPVLISNTKQLNGLVKEVPERAMAIIKKFWPGPLTLVFDKTDRIPDIVSCNSETVGIRMPDDKIVLEIIEKLGSPLVATSANLSGQEPPSRPEEIKIEADLLVDGGRCRLKIPSTVLDVRADPPLILRMGSIDPLKS